MPTWIAKYVIQPLLIYVIVPLFEKGIKAFFMWAKAKIKKFFRKRKNKKKVEAYEHADNREDNRDTFSNLP